MCIARCNSNYRRKFYDQLQRDSLASLSWWNDGSAVSRWKKYMSMNTSLHGCYVRLLPLIFNNITSSAPTRHWTMIRRNMCMRAVSRRHPPALTVCLWSVERGRRGCEVGRDNSQHLAFPHCTGQIQPIKATLLRRAASIFFHLKS